MDRMKANIKIPTKEECFELLEKYNVPENIVEHSKVVNKIANYLASKLKEKGFEVNLKLIDRASLLHDIAKMRSIEEGNEEDHCKMADDILKEEGYPEVGHVAKMHKLSKAGKLKTWEEKVVYYADKRVKHRNIVSLKERYRDLEERYNIPEHKKVPYKPIEKVEIEIFNAIKENPNILKKVIK